MTDHQPPSAVETLDLDAIQKAAENARAARIAYEDSDSVGNTVALCRAADRALETLDVLTQPYEDIILSLISALRHSVEREAGLRLALAPFAEAAGLYDDNLRPGLVLSDVALIRSQLTLGDLREARAALDRRAGT